MSGSGSSEDSVVSNVSGGSVHTIPSGSETYSDPVYGEEGEPLRASTPVPVKTINYTGGGGYTIEQKPIYTAAEEKEALNNNWPENLK